MPNTGCSTVIRETPHTFSDVCSRSLSTRASARHVSACASLRPCAACAAAAACTPPQSVPAHLMDPIWMEYTREGFYMGNVASNGTQEPAQRFCERWTEVEGRHRSASCSIFGSLKTEHVHPVLLSKHTNCACNRYSDPPPSIRKHGHARAGPGSL